MRLSLFILGVFAAVICIEYPLRRKTVGGAPITTRHSAVPGFAGL